jgi:hypothetical protein
MKRFLILFCTLSLLLPAQRPMNGLQIGSDVPPELQLMYEKGLQYLASSQRPGGDWPDSYGNQPGVVGAALLAFLASGEDPNYGPYRTVLQRGTEYIIGQQDGATGYIGTSMYNHGFATLALAELYGHLSDEAIGPALQKAVDLILESQRNNALGGWRYTPVSSDADTTVSGAQMVALLAARNAGLQIPEEALERGTSYYDAMMAQDGGIVYSGTSGSGNATRTAIASLVYSLQNEYQSPSSRKTFEYLRANVDETSSSYPYYHFYYLAQALFQGDMGLWQGWNRKILRVFEATQMEDGSWAGRRGSSFATSAALLSMALNYRLMPIYER